MTDSTPTRLDGKWALVTGASSGIGAAIAQNLAARGANVLLTARRTGRLADLSARLKSEYGVQTEVCDADLAESSAPERLFDFAAGRGLVIEVLVNNAGLTHYGEFHRSDVHAQLRMIQIHCSGVVHLTHLFLQGMIERARGHVLIVATTSLMPAPYMTTYAATKGFELLFAEGLAEEVARYGVRVCALCPGPTRTEMATHVDGSPAAAHERLQSAAQVAAKAVEGLLAGRKWVRPSFVAWVTANLPRFLPRGTVSGATERYYRPKQIR